MEDSEKRVDEEKSEISLNKEELQRRKEEFLKKLTLKKNYLIYIILAAIAIWGYKIRTKNLPLLQDKFPLALDPYAFLRYAQYILEHGKLMAVDTMRYHPFGYANLTDFSLLAHLMVYLYKFLNIFTDITLEKTVILYPAIAFVVGLVFFFLLVKKLFNWKVAVVASAFLTVLPSYLYRTMAGFSDKEAFAMALMFMTLYFLVSAWHDKKNMKRAIIYAALAGISNGLMGLVWGGVTSLFLIIGTYAIVQVLLNKFDKKDFYIYAIWFIILVVILNRGYPGRYAIGVIITSITTLVMVIGFFAGLTNYLFIQKNLFKVRSKIKGKMPYGLFCLIIPLALGLIVIIAAFGPSFVAEKGKELYIDMTEPFGRTRWSLTVAESHQPYFSDWKGQMNWKYLTLMFIGATLLFYEGIRRIKKGALVLSGSYLVFLLLFSMSRYSPSSMFNGVSTISKLTYIGSLVAFVILIIYLYIKSFYHDKETFESLKKINLTYFFVVLWFIFMIVAARSAIRLLFLFSPITAVMAGYGVVMLVEYVKRYVKQEMLKVGAYILIIFIAGMLLFNFSKAITVQAQYTGPSFNGQWQQAMGWVKDNTPEDSVFAHWWDYGYWVQTGGKRATLSDGGNALGGVNHFIGRHVLTGQSEREALEFLKARNATHLLMIKDEIGKYPAYSSIGADKDYDRYSWIPTFNMDPNQIMETRNATVYLFTGGTPVDHDIVYKEQLFPANSAGIGGFFIKVRNVEVAGPNGTKQTVQQFEVPEMALFYNGAQVRAPVNCVYFNNQKIMFNHPDGIDACLRIIPKIQGQGQMNPLGAILYLSPVVAKGNFARLFLMNEQSENFKLVYSDEDKGMPLALYNGMVIGPLKIWEISYPDDLVIPSEYYGTTIPDEVRQVRK